MTWKRIFATFAGDQESEQDKKATIIIHAKVDDKNLLDKSIQMFGYIQDFDEDLNQYMKYPFLSKVINGALVFDLGGHSEGEIGKTNLLEKEITQNELFTYYDGLDEDVDEWVYRIENVTDI